jgi:hypothetical protein
MNNDRDRLLHGVDEDSGLSSESINNSESVDILKSTSSHHEVHIYTRRWYIMAVFFAFSFLQGGMCNDWSNIGNSVKAAFGWSNGDLSLILTWLYSTYVVLLFPFAWLMENKGM